MNHFQLHRYCYPGASIENVCKPVVYSLEYASECPYAIDPVTDSGTKYCPLYGTPCLGHLEIHKDMLFLPSWMTPPGKNEENQLFLLKNQCLTGRMPCGVYINAVLATLRSKTGYTTSVSRMSVQGSLRMVITPANTCSESAVCVPRYIADKYVVPAIDGGTYTSRKLSECRYVILVRQPCMWTGGIQSVELRLTEPQTDGGTRPDVNCSMQIPVSLCIPYGADFDGDEMAIFGLLGSQSETECAAFSWNHIMYSPYVEDHYDHIVHSNTDVIGTKLNTTAICTTICWSDRLSGVQATPVHRKWMTSVSSVIAMKESHSPRELVAKGIASMTMACSKSSSQIDVGAYTRMSRIGSSRIHLSTNGVPMFGQRNMSVMCLDPIIYSVNQKDGWFGNPSIRAVSKLCSSVIQLTLKVKSMTNVENLSPTLSLMSGSDSWLCITYDGHISIHTVDTPHDFDQSETICSLYEISHAPDSRKTALVTQFVDIVLVECRRTLDIAEYHCLVLLLSQIASTPLHKPMGTETTIGTDYLEFSVFTVFSASYVDPKFAQTYDAYKVPVTIAEHMLLRYFHNTPSIA